MRLVCPNCDAEYEVDDAAIPMAGRDVQCSNCGHGWFQAHPEVEAAREADDKGIGTEAQAAAPVTSPPTVEPKVEAAAAAAVAMTPEAAVAATLKAAAAEPAAPQAAALVPSRALDDSVLAVLKEEAAREVAARKAEAGPAIETQTEMGLAPEATGLAAAAKRLARLQGTPEPEPAVVPKTRREMLPAIEEINSTLRATHDRRSDDNDAVVDTMAEARPSKAGFGRGFTTLLVLAVLAVALYLAAPLIGAKVPALAVAARDYVAMVDAGRVWLDTEIKALVATLRGIQGASGG